MLFCSQQFLLFFAALFGIYWALPWRRVRVWLLLAASFSFYASWNKKLALIICASTALDFALALAMEHSTVNWRRKVLLGTSLAANLGLLCYFKYANFFLQSLTAALHAAGASTSLPLLKVILPIGISFYTFEAINYTIDVYRRRIPAERNLGDFMLFILFFPHLVAGPIVRAKDFLPQIKRPKRWDWLRLNLGVQYFLMGLVKKQAIADRLAEYVDPIFAAPSAYRGEAILLAVIAYAAQIYCDFSGYTDMAIGAAHMLGYKLAKNFNMPYLAANVAEFWRRWHMSLSSWLRDYLFIPLGGSRGKHWRTAANLMITMTLGGLWHGASWAFVVWGMLHGAFLIGHRIFRAFSERLPLLDRVLRTPPGTALRMLLTFACVAIGWVFFRSTTFHVALTILHRLIAWSPGLGPPLPRLGLLCTLIFMWACHGAAHLRLWKPLRILPAPMWGFASVAIVNLAQVLAPDAGKAFIYFQF